MANTSTSPNAPALEAALANIPRKFRNRIIETYLEIKKRYSEAMFDSSFDTAGLSAGKFSETTLRFLQHELTGTHIPFGKHIHNFPDEAQKLIQLPTTSGVESLRIIIPRALVFLYTLRGKRGIGHVGGDVEANGIDAATIVRITDWIVCELIRIYHKLSLEEAQAIVDTLSARNLPDIWEVAGRKRILRTDLNFGQKVLLLTYADSKGGVLVEDLYDWVEHNNMGNFKSHVLSPLHQKKLIEFDRESQIVFLSPTGVKEVEENILSKVV